MGPGGEREIAVEDLFTGYLETVLANNELITGVTVPSQAGRRAAYLKCTARSADDWPALGLAVSFGLLVDALVVRRVLAPALAVYLWRQERQLRGGWRRLQAPELVRRAG